MGGCNSPLIQNMENKMGYNSFKKLKAQYDEIQSLLNSIIGIKNCHRRLIEDTKKKWYDDTDPYDPDFKIEMNYNDWLYMNARMKDIYERAVWKLEDIEKEGCLPADVNHYTSKELKGEYSRWGC
tara:strand:+ start:2078 stop:2452 length:375 start_codon:yes stop_codon:yes gene_type:complete